jgi:hypothetical protein
MSSSWIKQQPAGIDGSIEDDAKLSEVSSCLLRVVKM